MNSKLLQVIAIRPFFFLILAEIFSQIATNMVNFVLILVAFEIAHSNTAVSGIVLSFTIPAIVFGLLAGVYVDRRNKKTVLFICNIARAAFLVLLALTYNNLFFLYLISFIVATISQFFIPAETPIIPVLVRDNKLLLSANALFGMGIYGSLLLAYALSGPFLIFFGKSYIFMILAIFFALASLFVSFISVPKKIEKLGTEKDNNDKKVYWVDEIGSAFKLVTKTKKIYHSFFLLILSQIIVLTLAVVGPGFAQRIMGIKVEEFPFFFVTPAALGMVVGAIAIGIFFHNHSKEKMANLGVLLSGLCLLALPYGSKVASRSFIESINTYLPHILIINILHIVVVLAFLLGFANALVFVPSNTILQEETSEELRGKVYGSMNALVGVFSFVPIIVVGGLADLLGVNYVLSGIGAGLLAFSVFRVLFR